MAIGGNVVRITPTLDTSGAYANGDVFFNYTEIPNVVHDRGGVSRIVGISAFNLDAQSIDCELIFHQEGGTTKQNLGTLNSQPNISDLNFGNLGYLGTHQMQQADWISNDSSSDSAATMYTSAFSQADANPVGFLLKANEGSKSVYVSAVAKEAITIGAATNLTIIIHVEYL